MGSEAMDKVAVRILTASRNRLCTELPFLDRAFCSLKLQPSGGETLSAACDGEALHINADFAADRFLRSDTLLCRLYFHCILHCMLRHLWRRQGRDPMLWDIACDAAAEHLLDSLEYDCIRIAPNPARMKFYGECLTEMRVLTAENIYAKLLRDRRSDYELAALSRAFLQDDHSLWEKSEKRGERNESEAEQLWNKITEQLSGTAENFQAPGGAGGEAIRELVHAERAERRDYRSFLRSFTAIREVLRADDDSFDPGWYCYGLSHYGNMPLIEPPETSEQMRIDDLVIVIDTSMSTSGAVVRSFLEETFSLLCTEGTFLDRMRVHILQCDDKIRTDTLITNRSSLESYMNGLTLTGGSTTDFRPAFDSIEGLAAAGEFGRLRGILYFTDGIGIYPKRAPKWKTAFLMPEEPPSSVCVPPWAIRVILGQPDVKEMRSDL